MPQSSLLLENLTTGIIPVGTPIVIDTEKARAYDSKTDSLDDIIGVVSALEYISGREWSPFYTGPACYENDSIFWNEDLTMQLVDDAPVENPGYTPFNPYSETDKYSVIVCHGFAAILNSYTLPTRWKLIKAKTSYNWVLIL